MLSQVPEKQMRIVRWVLAIGWIILIISLFYDPISDILTDPNNQLSPFSNKFITEKIANNPELCIKVQTECVREFSYQIGTKLFWSIIVPFGIIIVFVFGHETWRRICPLYFLSQIPRALTGNKPKLDINQNTWLQKNYFYVQFALFFIGITCRILFVNSERLLLGIFLILTILSAITTVFLYGGRTWCHYVCPFGMVQTAIAGPRGVLGSEAHTAPPRSITQSMCRTIDKTSNREISACISCTQPCLDIDAEGSYWEELSQPGRKLVQYGYVGLVIGYFLYFYLYAGNWSYYYSSVWVHEKNQLATLFQPGFFILGEAIPIPKIVAAPLTLGFFAIIFCLIGSVLEKVLFSILRQSNPSLTKEENIHKVFTLCTFFAVNFFFIYGKPAIIKLTLPVHIAFHAVVLLVSSFWLYRTWNRSYEEYTIESKGDKLRRKLKKLPVDLSQHLQGRSLDDLKASELNLLQGILPNLTKEYRFQVYEGILLDALDTGNVTPQSSRDAFRQMRRRMNISDEEHQQILSKIEGENPGILAQSSQVPATATGVVFAREGWKPADGMTRLGNPNNAPTRSGYTRLGGAPKPLDAGEPTRIARPQQRPLRDNNPTRISRPAQPGDDATRRPPDSSTRLPQNPNTDDDTIGRR